MKFPLKTGSFIIKIKASSPIVERLSGIMDFQKFETLNYDPHKVISQRRQQNKNKSFEHQVVEGMDKIANLLIFE